MVKIKIPYIKKTKKAILQQNQSGQISYPCKIRWPKEIPISLIPHGIRLDDGKWEIVYISEAELVVHLETLQRWFKHQACKLSSGPCQCGICEEHVFT